MYIYERNSMLQSFFANISKTKTNNMQRKKLLKILSSIQYN